MYLKYHLLCSVLISRSTKNAPPTPHISVLARWRLVWGGQWTSFCQTSKHDCYNSQQIHKVRYSCAALDVYDKKYYWNIFSSVFWGGPVCKVCYKIKGFQKFSRFCLKAWVWVAEKDHKHNMVGREKGYSWLNEGLDRMKMNCDHTNSNHYREVQMYEPEKMRDKEKGCDWLNKSHTHNLHGGGSVATHSMDGKGNLLSWLNRASTHTTWITVERGTAGWIGTTHTRYDREKRCGWLNGVTQSMRGWLREGLRLAKWGHTHRYGRQIGYALINETTHTR